MCAPIVRANAKLSSHPRVKVGEGDVPPAHGFGLAGAVAVGDL